MRIGSTPLFPVAMLSAIGFLIGCGGDDDSAGSSGAGTRAGRDSIAMTSNEVVQAADSDSALLSPDYTAFDGMPISIRKPLGFTDAPREKGFIDHASGAQITFSHQRTAYTTLIQFPLMQTAERRQAKYGDKTGLFVSGRQKMPGPVQVEMGVWAAMLGDEQEMVMVWGFFPLEAGEDKSAAVRAAVLSTRWTKALGDPFADLDYRLTLDDRLRYAGKADDLMLFTADGRVDSPGPRFTASPAYAAVNVADPAQFARDRFSAGTDITNPEIQVHDAVTIDGLSGFETIGGGTDAATGAQVVSYQLILFEPQRYWVFRGRTDAGGWETDVPLFIQMAASFSRK